MEKTVDRKERRKEREHSLRDERLRNSIFVVRAKALLAESETYLDKWMSFTELWSLLGSRTELPAGNTYWSAKGWFTTPAALATHIYALPETLLQELGIRVDLEMVPGRPNPVSKIMFSTEIGELSPLLFSGSEVQ